MSRVGHKIPAIENLGIAKVCFLFFLFCHGSAVDTAQDQDAIDFTDNSIASLGNFPFFPRLQTLLLARNRIKQIQPTLASSVPSLTTLVLTSNNLTELADLDPLRNLSRLTHLVLLDNPVTRKEVGCFVSAPFLSLRARLNYTELSVLDYLENSLRSVPRLPKSKRR